MCLGSSACPGRASDPSIGIPLRRVPLKRPTESPEWEGALCRHRARERARERERERERLA